MRGVFMGSSVFSCPTLQMLLLSNHDVVGVYTKKPRNCRRGMKKNKNDIRISANFLLKQGLFYNIFCSCCITGNVSLMVRKLKCILLHLFTLCRTTHHIPVCFLLHLFKSNLGKIII